MATRNSYVDVPTPGGDVAQVLSVGTVTRQWMSPQGVYLNEIGTSAGVTAVNPVVQTTG